MPDEPYQSSPEDEADGARQPFPAIALRPRHDGWTADRQIAFIEALAESACVDEACRRVGLSRQSAYVLRRRPVGRPFRDAWDAALDYAMHQLEQAAIGRALRGVPRPVFYKGEQVGEWRHYDERLAMFLLRYRRQARYGPWLDREVPMVPGEDDYPPDEAALRLDFNLGEIADLGEWDEDWEDDEGGNVDPPRAEGA